MADAAIVELESVRQYQTDRQMITPYVFTTTGTAPSSGVSKAKAVLDQAIAENRVRIGSTEPMEHWVLHDLRRAQATALAEAGFSETVVDRIQNHVAVGSRPSAVAAVYTLAKLLPERARALDYWTSLVTERSGEVIRLANAQTRKVYHWSDTTAR